MHVGMCGDARGWSTPADRSGSPVVMSTHTATRDGGVLLSPADVARLASVSRATVYRAIERGELRVLHAGRSLRIDPADFRRWLERSNAP